MGYVSLNCEWAINGKSDGYRTSRPTKDGEDYIATTIAGIKADHPKATNIVVVEEPYNEGHPYAIDTLIGYIRIRRPDISAEDIEDAKFMLLTDARDRYRRGAYITSLAEAKKIFDDEDSDYNDWVYLREFGIVLFNVTEHTSHELFLTHWYHVLVHVLPTKANLEKRLLRGDHKTDPEKFLHAKCGFFLTSAHGIGMVTKSADMKLNAQEKTVFGRFKFRDIEPR